MTYRQTPASHGALWFTQGWRLFLQKPLLLLGMLFSTIVILSLLNFIPLGDVIGALLGPLLISGLYTALDHIGNGQVARFELLFSGFRQHTRPLVVLGLLLLAVQLFIGLLLFLALGETFFTKIASGELPAEQIFPVALQTAPLFFIVVLVLAIVVLIAYQFALPLVTLNGIGPMQALKLSLHAGLHNWQALLVFSLVYLGLAILATLPMLLGWIVLAPVLLCATYAAYRDIFQAARVTPTETIIA